MCIVVLGSVVFSGLRRLLSHRVGEEVRHFYCQNINCVWHCRKTCMKYSFAAFEILIIWEM